MEAALLHIGEDEAPSEWGTKEVGNGDIILLSHGHTRGKQKLVPRAQPMRTACIFDTAQPVGNRNQFSGSNPWETT